MALVYYSNAREVAPIKVFLRILAIVFFLFFSQAPLSADTKHENLEEYRSKGLAAQQQGLFQDAAAYYEKALSLDEERADICNDLGIVYEHLGDPYQARNYYLKAIDLDEKYLPGYLNLAYFYKRQGDSAQAIEYFKKRIALGRPVDPWARRAVEELRLLSEASPESKEWLQKYESNVLAREVKIAGKKLDGAQEKRYLADLAGSEKYVRRGEAYDKEEMYEEALAQYDIALSLTPSDPRILEYRRLVLLKLKEDKIDKVVNAALKEFSTRSLDSSNEGSRQMLAVTPDE